MKRSNARRARAAITLIELMITVALMALLAAAVAAAFTAGLDVERRRAQGQTEQEQITMMERHITRILQGAILSASAQDRFTYFIGDNVGDTLTPLPQSGTQVGSASTPTNSASSLSNSNSSNADMGCTRLTFTTVAPAVPMRSRTDDNDFETQMQQNGPIGGVAEISLATTAVGDPGDRTGLFERIQRPSDGDPSQGGTESILGSQIDTIGFLFWNGTDWIDSWNTTGASGRRLPGAVQVSYQLRNDVQHAVHRFFVTIPNSDVTPQNPVLNTPTASGGTQ